MAQRSRAAAACLPCKANKSRCSDFRPCARCNKSGTKLCTDLQSESFAKEPRSSGSPWVIGANSSTTNLRADFSNDTHGCMPEGASAYFLHCRSDNAPLERMLAGLEEAMPAEEQVNHQVKKVGL